MPELIFYIFTFITIVIVLGYFLGYFIAQSFIYNDEGKNTNLFFKSFSMVDNLIFKVCGIQQDKYMTGKIYYFSLIVFNFIIIFVCALMLYFQELLPFGKVIENKLSFSVIAHTVISFITNTDQIHIIPESQLTILSSYFVIPFLMFVSSATGIAVGVMFIRSVTLGTIGNFYVDFVKSCTRILFPISLILSLIFVFLGSPNTFQQIIPVTTLENIKELILLGPIAAIEALTILGENGGSYFNANASHPFCNPTYFSNLLHTASMILIPAALIITLGFWLKNIKQSIIILIALLSIFIFQAGIGYHLEINGNKEINNIIGETSANWVGKESRFGIVPSLFFSLISSSTSGANNSAFESYHPYNIAFFLFNMACGPVFGNQGVGPINALNFFIYTAIVIGFMLGKSPEIFGRRIEKKEIILSSLLLLLNAFLVLLGVLITFLLNPLQFSTIYENIHEYTRTFYEFFSAAANNGSGLEGLIDNTTYLNVALAITMFVAWFGAIGLMIALGESLSTKNIKLNATPQASFKTDTILTSFLYLFIMITLTLLIYFPFLIIGPAAEVFIHN